MHDSEDAKESVPFLQGFYEAGNSLPLFEFDELSDAEWLRGIAAQERTYRPETTIWKLPDRYGRDRAKMTESRVREMRADREAGMAWNALADKYDTAKSNCQSICNFKTWKDVK